MLRHDIIQYAPVIFALVVILYIVIKLLLINVMRLRSDPMKLFIESFKIYSIQVVKNTFHSQLKKYYKSSNRINMVFYVILMAMLAIYILLKVL